MNKVYQMPKDKADQLQKAVKQVIKITSMYGINLEESEWEMQYLKEEIEKAYPKLIMSGFLEEDGKYTRVHTDGGHALFAFDLMKKIKKKYEDHLEALEIVKNMNIVSIHEDYITFPKMMSGIQKDWISENKQYFNEKQMESLNEYNRVETKYFKELNKRMSMMSF